MSQPRLVAFIIRLIHGALRQDLPRLTTCPSNPQTTDQDSPTPEPFFFKLILRQLHPLHFWLASHRAPRVEHHGVQMLLKAL